MALFATGVASQSTTLPSAGTTPTVVWNPNSTALAALSPAVTLKDVTLLNAGSNICWLGQSTVTTTTGVQLSPGQQITIQGSSYTSGSATGSIYAICGVGTATTILADLATLASVV